MTSLNLVASINGWEPIICPEVLYYWNDTSVSVITKPGIKNALEWLEAHNEKKVA